MPQPWDYIAKVVNIGDSSCGKSSLTIRLCEGRFTPTHDVTIGVEFGSRIIPVGPPAYPIFLPQSPTSPSSSFSPSNHSCLPPSTQPSSSAPPSPSKSPTDTHQKKIKLQIWDTAGQESFRAITKSYFRGATGALLVFDLTRRETYEHAQSWLDELREGADPNISIILVGNKADLCSDGDGKGKAARAVTEEEAQEWVKRNGVKAYVETSAKSGDGVERAFVECAQEIWRNIEGGVYDLEDRRNGIKRNAGVGGLRVEEGKRIGGRGCC